MSDQAKRQVIALAGVFQAAATVDRVARTGHYDETSWRTLMQATLDTSPDRFSQVYGDDLVNLRVGIKALQEALDNPSQHATVMRYALSMVMVMRHLRRNDAMLTTLSERLSQACQQAHHFGPTHENVILNLGELYQDTLSKLPRRIVVHGDPGLLQSPMMPERIRAALLSGIRFAMLWHQQGGRRWQLVLRRKAIRQMLSTLAV